MLLQLQQKYLTHAAKQGSVKSYFHLDIKLLLKWTALTLKMKLFNYTVWLVSPDFVLSLRSLKI